MIFITYLITLTLCFFLTLTIIKLYFKAKKGRYSIENNYIFKYSIGVLFTAFCLVNPKVTPHIANWIIQSINYKFGENYKLLPTDLEFNTILLYGIFCLTVIILLITAFKSRNQKAIQHYITRKENFISDKRKISFPENSYYESPIFHERIKKYFELKYKKQELILNISTKDKLIYGKYNEGFRHYFIVIKYDENELETDISSQNQQAVSNEIQKIVKSLKPKEDKTDYLYDYFYIIEKGKFNNSSNNNIHTKTEDDILNELIDFNFYLRTIISKFNNDKIFSAIAKDSEKKTLSETFIMPSYSLDDENSKNSHNLEEYVTNWLKKSPVPKHLALLGDYGMGKTSFLKYYSHKLAHEILNTNKVLRFPVFISLNNTSPRHGGIKKTTSSFVAENLGVDYELFEILIHKGKILFLLDAFDEMGFVGTHDDRFKQINEIWQLAYKNNKILLSGRASHFPSNDELKQTLNIIPKEDEIIQTEPYCTSIRLELLDESKIKKYLSKYYKEERSIQFFNWLENSPSIIELCKRPSLMHIIREMLPNLYRKDSKEIYNPGNAIEKYIDYWINRQESKNIQSAFSDDKKKREFIKSFFRHIAVHSFKSKQYKLSSDFIKNELHKFIDKNEIKNLSEQYHIEGFENEMLTAYFIEIENDHFRFVHKSFFEFFVATEITLLLKNNDFKNKILFEDWSNPIVNFIYDSIPSQLKLNKHIPALLLLKQNTITGNIKNYLARFLLKNEEKIISFSILIFTILSVYCYFKFINLSNTALILIFIPFLIILILIIVILHIIFVDLLSINKNVKFTIKAFKVAFIKKQFDVIDNLHIVIPLLKNRVSPHIPLENVDFNSQAFKNCNFYRLKNINFNNCKFDTPILRNCHLNNVNFKNSKMSNIFFSTCRFTNVDFNKIKFTKSESFDINKKRKKKRPLIYFSDCKFDDETLLLLIKFINENSLTLGENINGCNNFINRIKNVS